MHTYKRTNRRIAVCECWNMRTLEIRHWICKSPPPVWVGRSPPALTSPAREPEDTNVCLYECMNEQTKGKILHSRHCHTPHHHQYQVPLLLSLLLLLLLLLTTTTTKNEWTFRTEFAGRETRFDNFGGNSVPGADLLIRSGCSSNSKTLDAVGMNCWHAWEIIQMWNLGF